MTQNECIGWAGAGVGSFLRSTDITFGAPSASTGGEELRRVGGAQVDAKRPRQPEEVRLTTSSSDRDQPEFEVVFSSARDSLDLESALGGRAFRRSGQRPSRR